MDCSKVQNLFSEYTFQCFDLNTKEKTIELFERKDNEMDTQIFEELQLITKTLMKSECDFYVCDNGNIVLKKESE